MVVTTLKQCFEVNTCYGDSNLVDGMIRISIPDLIYLNLDSIQTEGRAFFVLLSHSFSNIPVIVLGDQNSFFLYSVFFKMEQFTQLNCSKIDNTVIKEVCRILKLNYNDTINNSRNTNSGNNRKTVLLVDDSALQNRISKNILDPYYNVKISMSAKQATELINQNKPDIIILDYDMPDIDGCNFLRVLRDNPQTEEIPVIFLTGIVDKEHIAKVIPLKPDGYLLKPVVAEKLLARIKELI